jgi:hypothetical protein
MKWDKRKYIAKALPTKYWLSKYDTREVEKRLRAFGLSQKMAKIEISNAKQNL